MDTAIERSIVRVHGGTGERAIVQAVTAADQPVRVGDKCVGVGRRLQVAILVSVELSLGKLRVVLLQVDLFQRLAQRQLLRIPNAQVFAQVHHGPERLRREVDAAVQVAQVW